MAKPLPINPVIDAGAIADMAARANLRDAAASLVNLSPAEAKNAIVRYRHPDLALITDGQAEILINLLGLGPA